MPMGPMMGRPGPVPPRGPMGPMGTPVSSHATSQSGPNKPLFPAAGQVLKCSI